MNANVITPSQYREQLLNREIAIMTARLVQDGPAVDDVMQQGGLIFTGNLHDTVPRALILSKGLGPREKLAWQVIRLYAPGNRAAVFPSYSEMQHQLATADKERASRDAVSQTIKILRLERWLSLVDTVRLRDKQSGRLLACRNIYALHDEPMPFMDAEELDIGYMALLDKCLSDKSSKTLQEVAKRQLSLMKHDDTMRHQHTRLALIEARLAAPQFPADMLPPSVCSRIIATDTRSPETGPRDEAGSDIPGPETGLRSSPGSAARDPVSGKSAKSLKKAVVRDPVPLYVRSSFSEKTKNTYVYPGESEKQPLPVLLADRLNDNDQLQVLQMCARTDVLLANQILTEACKKITARQLHNPCGWVLKMLQLARQGNWNPPTDEPEIPASAPRPAAVPTGGKQPSSVLPAPPAPPAISRTALVEQMLARYRNGPQRHDDGRTSP